MAGFVLRWILRVLITDDGGAGLDFALWNRRFQSDWRSGFGHCVPGLSEIEFTIIIIIMIASNFQFWKLFSI